MTGRDRFSSAVTLAIGAYLGFYVFGLIMGVYSPGGVPYFTIPAGVFVGVLMGQLIGFSQSRQGGRNDDQLTRETRHVRETRGY